MSAAGVGRETFRETIRRILADPSYAPHYGFLWDRQQVQVPETRDVQGIAQVLRHEAGLEGTRWAIVTANPAGFGMGRMLAFLSERHIRIQVFETLEAARAWLETTRS